MPSYRFEGFAPVVDPTAFVHPSALLIGHVILGPGCYVGPGASLRGDFGRIVLQAGCNVQDNCVLHMFPDQQVLLEEGAHIGHGAVLHGCVVRRGALVGIRAVVMDDAEVGEEAFVGACAFVKSRFQVPPRTLVTGVPARVVRELTADEIAWKAHGTTLYQQLATRCLADLEECTPLAQVEPGRPVSKPVTAVPLHVMRRGES